MRLVVGCPVRDRAWIMERWFEHVEAAVPAGADVHYVFCGDPQTDAASFRVIDRECLVRSRDRTVVELDEIYSPSYKRVWNLDRFSHMVRLRNSLLVHVRRLEPDFFWSLDSDILAAPSALSGALEGADRFDAVGTKLYMTPKGTVAPSYGMLNPQGGLRRPDSDGFFKVDVIMASKVMAPKAYAVDYELHRQGEDIGWSIAARAAGCSLGWDGRTTSRHVMSESDLAGIDTRAGF